MARNAKSQLKKEVSHVQQNLNHIRDSLVLLGKTAPSLRRYSFSHLKTKLETLPDNHILSTANISIYNTQEAFIEKFPELTEKIPTAPQTLHTIITDREDELLLDYYLTLERYVSSKKTFPFYIGYAITNHFFKKLNTKEDIELGLFFSGPLGNGSRTDLIAGSSNIQSNPLLENKIKTYLQTTPLQKRDTKLNTIRVSTSGYYIYTTPTPYSPNLYIVALKTTNHDLITKANIIVGTIIVLMLISLCIFGVYALIIRKITSSIDVLSSVSEKVAQGNLDQHIYLDVSDEIGELANIFNQMVINLRDSSNSVLREKERSEAIISAIPEGIIVTDLENRLILANKKAEEMFNFTNNQVQGKYLLEYIHHEDLINIYSEKRRTSQKPLTRDLQIPDKSGTNHIYSLTSSVVENNLKDPIGIITVLRDLTYEKQIEELRDGFLRTVSHELRTPLTSVMGFIELVKHGSGGDISDEQKGYLDTAHKEASTLKTLIDDLLDLSQMSAGKSKMMYTSINVKEFLDNIITTLTPIANRKGLKLDAPFNDASLDIKADSAKLRRIILNLVSNAIKFTQEGSITITCTPSEKEIKFDIIDTGIGIREEEQDVIFEKFRQVDYSSTRKYEGIGLGLSIVKQLVEMHKGSISVESTYGEGSIFSFTIERK